MSISPNRATATPKRANGRQNMADSMRFDWRRMVVRDPDLTEATRRVLLELESWANPDGTNARPGLAGLVGKLRTPRGHVNERTARRALADGVARGFIERTVKGHGGSGRNTADCYSLRFPKEMAEVATSPETTCSGDTNKPSEPRQFGGHPNVHRIRPHGGHWQDVTGHSEQFDGHAGVQLPDPTTRSSTPEISSHLSNASDASDPITNPLVWIDTELPGGFRRGERKRAQQMLDEGTEYGSIRFALLRERSEEISRIRSSRLRGSHLAAQKLRQVSR